MFVVVFWIFGIRVKVVVLIVRNCLFGFLLVLSLMFGIFVVFVVVMLICVI